MKEFTDISVQESRAGKTFCYRSGLAVFEETLTGGVVVNSGFNTAGYPLNVLTNFPTRTAPGEMSEPFAFNFEVDGETVCRKMENVSFDITEENGKKHAEAVFQSGVKPVVIREHTSLDGSQLVKRTFEIENTSSAPAAVNRMVLFGGVPETVDPSHPSWTARPDERAFYSVGYFGHDEWGREGEFAWHDLGNTTQVIDTRFDAERFRHPLLFIRNNVTGTVFFMQLAWSGGCRFTVGNTGKPGGKVRLRLTAEITGYAPLTVLRPGENFTTPAVYFGAVHGDLDDAVNEMLKGIRRSALNRKSDLPFCLVGAGMGAEHDMSVETTESYMRQMRDMGAEVFIVDAGWSCPPGKETEWHRYNGVNRPDAERYPDDGFTKLREYCHSLGMRFGIWLEPERLGSYADVREKHPEWFASDLFGAKTDGFLDLTVNEAAEWMKNEIVRVLTDYKPDLLRIDYNVSGRDAFALRDTGTGREECLSVRHYRKVYEIYGEVKRLFPQVIFENCAGGGGRTDLGMLPAFDHSWVSDDQIMPRSVRITDGMTMALPPERVDRLFAGMECHIRGSLDAHMRNTMLTHMSLNVIAPPTAVPDERAMEFIRHSTEIYKNFIRPFLPESLVYHHTPTDEDVDKTGLSVLEVASPDRAKAAIAVFSLGVPSAYRQHDGFSAERNVIFPRGIDAGKKYRVTLDNTGESFVTDGRTLKNHGVPVRLPSVLSSELILIEEVS